jgi:uncharacterized protein (DUF2147 family)
MRYAQVVLISGLVFEAQAQDMMDVALPVWESPSATAEAGDAILGKWQIADDDSHIVIEVAKDSSGYVAWISYMDEPYHAEDASDGLAGCLKLDRHNPDSTLRRRSVLGLVVLSELVYRDGRWRDGRIYSPDNGKSYRAWARLEGDRLRVKGYIKIGFIKLGRSMYLRRAAAPDVTVSTGSDDRSFVPEISPFLDFPIPEPPLTEVTLR